VGKHGGGDVLGGENPTFPGGCIFTSGNSAGTKETGEKGGGIATEVNKKAASGGGGRGGG
jgi:hypothetical protein